MRKPPTAADILEWLGIEYLQREKVPRRRRSIWARWPDGQSVQREARLLVLSRRRLIAPEEFFRSGERLFQNTCKRPLIRRARPKRCWLWEQPKIALRDRDDAQKIARKKSWRCSRKVVSTRRRGCSQESEVERGRFDDAGKAYMGVALLYVTRRSRRGPCTKPRWLMAGRRSPRKPTGPGNSRKNILTTSAVKPGRGENFVVKARQLASTCGVNKLRPLIAEFIGAFALVFVGIGAIQARERRYRRGPGSWVDDRSLRFPPPCTFPAGS